MMNIARILGKNVFFVWLGFASHVLVTLLLTPLMISELGQESYGLWLFLQGFIGYYGLLDMGLRAGVNQTVTQRISTRDNQPLLDFLNGTLPVLWKCAGVVLGIGLILGVALPKWLALKTVNPDVVSWVIVIQSLGVAISFCLFPFLAILTALQRYDLSETTTLFTKVLSAFSTYLILKTQPSILLICVSMFAFNLLDQIIKIGLTFAIIPALREIKPKANRVEVMELITVGGWNFMCQLSNLLLQTYQSLFIGSFFSLSTLVPFSLGKSLAEYFNRLIGISSRVFYPMFVHLEKRGDQYKSKQLFLLTCRISVSFSSLVCIFGITWIEPFLEIWLGNVENKADLISSTRNLFLIFSITFVFENLRGVASQYVMGRNQVAFLGKAMIFEAAITICLATIMGRYFGLLGVASGNLIAYGISIFVFHFPKYMSLLSISYPKVLFEIFAKPIVYIILVAVGLFAYTRIQGEIKTLSHILLKAVVPATLIASVFAPVLLTKDQAYSCFGFMRDKFRKSVFREN
jgi:O-antigen/teichoic acid export membrane protein